MPASGPVGILLAAGSGTRFGGDKLLAPLPQPSASLAATADCEGERIGTAACRHLIAALPRPIAVIRPDDAALAASLGAAGARIVRCADARLGMGASLACGVRASADAAAWVIALADMPWILPSTIERIVAALAQGAPVAAPFHRGMRGHPVGFSAQCYPLLAALAGDEGAKSVIAAYADELAHIGVEDPGILIDIDTRADLRAARE